MFLTDFDYFFELKRDTVGCKIEFFEFLIIL